MKLWRINSGGMAFFGPINLRKWTTTTIDLEIWKLYDYQSDLSLECIGTLFIRI